MNPSEVLLLAFLIGGVAGLRCYDRACHCGLGGSPKLAQPA